MFVGIEIPNVHYTRVLIKPLLSTMLYIYNIYMHVCACACLLFYCFQPFYGGSMSLPGHDSSLLSVILTDRGLHIEVQGAIKVSMKWDTSTGVAIAELWPRRGPLWASNFVSMEYLYWPAARATECKSTCAASKKSTVFHTSKSFHWKYTQMNFCDDVHWLKIFLAYNFRLACHPLLHNIHKCANKLKVHQFFHVSAWMPRHR